MKKIITIVLAIECAFTLFSCGGGATETSIDEINSMYNAVSPSRVEVTATKTFGKYALKTVSTLVVGEVDGFAVTTFNQTVDKPNALDENVNATILGAISPVEYSWVYHEDLGYKENGGKWDLEAADPTPETGAIALNLSAGAVEEFNNDEENKTVTFVVLPENSEEVFGYALPSNANVTIVHSGADIVSVKIEYTETNAESEDYPDIAVTIEAKYSYVAQQVEFE